MKHILSRDGGPIVCLQPTGGNIIFCFSHVIVPPKNLKAFKLFILPASNTSSKLNLCTQINRQVFDFATKNFSDFRKLYHAIFLTNWIFKGYIVQV